MIPKKYSSKGIVLARKNFSEADRIIAVYSKDYGKLTFIAKGVRKLKSRKRGSLEVFSHIKFAASRGKSLDIMTEVEAINPFNRLRKELEKASVAYFFMETVGRLTRDGAKSISLYSYVLYSIKKLDNGDYKNLRVFRREFIKDCLEILGFWPKGKKLENPDEMLEIITERQMNSVRVGKRLLI